MRVQGGTHAPAGRPSGEAARTARWIGARWIAGGLLDLGEAFLRTRGSFFLLALLAGVGFALVGIRGGDGSPADIDVLVTLFLLEVGGVTALALAGGVSGELRRGIALLWIPKPLSIPLYYLSRSGQGLVLAVVLALVFLGVQALVLAGLGADWMRFVAAAAPPFPSVILLVGAGVFLLSCMGIQGDALAALVVSLVWVGAGEFLRTQVGLAGMAGLLLRESGPPLGFVFGLREWGLGGEAPSAAEGLRYLIWVVCVVGTALMVLGSRLRRPFPTEQSR